jgi:hypothetical protein
MTQYWIQIPVENAREVVQRKVDELVAAGGYWSDIPQTVSYDSECEVIFYGDQLADWDSYYDRFTIYFGTFVVNLDQLTSGTMNIEGYNVLDWASYPPMAGHYPCAIWNDITGTFDATAGYFAGYKFTLS